MMKKYFFLLVGLCFLFSCAARKKSIFNGSYSGGDGSSFENAVVINENSESHGVDDEYAWIKTHYPASANNGQALVFHDQKPFDIIQITTRESKALSVYFDISKFYGKLQ